MAEHPVKSRLLDFIKRNTRLRVAIPRFSRNDKLLGYLCRGVVVGNLKLNFLTTTEMGKIRIISRDIRLVGGQ